MPILTVIHRTRYRYRKPVSFGEHRMMMRPRDTEDQRQLGATLDIEPAPSELRWLQDVFGNNVAIARFHRRSAELVVTNTLRIGHSGVDRPVESWISFYARTTPFSYDADEMPDLLRMMERFYPDPAHELDRWARSFLRQDGPTATLDLLEAMTRSIRRQITYKGRQSSGIQTPVETLRLGTGTCRDFAVLMIEALRCLGFAARFVSGYIYVPPPGDTVPDTHRGGGNTHAWVQVYLPGAGWVEFDPTNNIIGSRDLIRVCVVRDPRQAVPLSGTWSGSATDCLGMDVTVDVTCAKDG